MPDPGVAGEVVTFTVTVGNNGPDVSTGQITVDMSLPPGVPADLEAYLAGDPASIAAYDAMWASIQVDPVIWQDNVSGMYFGEDSYCEGFYIQPQDLAVGAAVTGTVVYEASLPANASRATVHFAGPGLDEEITSYGRGGCSDVALDCTGIPCLGPRLTAYPAVTAPLEYGYTADGSTTGGSPLVDFTVGNIAIIDRGDAVAFELKTMMAVNAGAAAVIIADHDDFTDSTVEPYDIINMACTDFCSQDVATIPVALISWAHGEAVRAAMALGEITLTMGAMNTNGVHHSSGYVWEFGGVPTDSDPSNDGYTETTTVVVEAIFADGFESGNTSYWQ